MQRLRENAVIERRTTNPTNHQPNRPPNRSTDQPFGPLHCQRKGAGPPNGPVANYSPPAGRFTTALAHFIMKCFFLRPPNRWGNLAERSSLAMIGFTRGTARRFVRFHSTPILFTSDDPRLRASCAMIVLPRRQLLRLPRAAAGRRCDQ